MCRAMACSECTSPARDIRYLLLLMLILMLRRADLLGLFSSGIHQCCWAVLHLCPGLARRC